MRILALADEVSKYYYDYFQKEKLEGIDLILSCGDLRPQYLSFIATYAKAPVLYVHGNHDDRYKYTPPDGCICIEDEIYVHNGVRILGLGGSMRYKEGNAEYTQYTQKEMEKRIKKLKRVIRKHNGFDILLTHSPAFQFGDAEDLPHQGFEAFIALLNEYHPNYFVHGHVHKNYSRKFERERNYCGTTVINAFERYLFDYEEKQE